MRPSRLLALAATAALASSPAAAHPPHIAGTPLLELSGQGVQRTLQTIPNCGLAPPCDYRNPRSASWHVVLFTDGRASVSIVDNALEDTAGARAEAVLGLGDPSILALVRQLLAGSRIGFATGDCRLSVNFPAPVSDGRVEVLDFDWRVTWYGRGNRTASFELPMGSPHFCDDQVAETLDWLVTYAHTVRLAAAP